MKPTKPAVTSQFPRRLSGPAADYLAQLGDHLGDLDRRLRARLLAVAADNLAERPEVTSFQDLAAQIGGPHDYARMLRNEAEAAVPGAVDRSRRRRRALRWWTVVVVTVVVAAGATATTWWVRWQADIHSNTLRVCGNAATLADEFCSDDGMKPLPLAHAMSVVCRGTVSVSANLHAEPDVTVTGASLNGVSTPADDPPLLAVTDSGPLPWLTVTDVQAWQNTDPEWNPIRTDWPLTIGRYPTDTFVTFVITACPPAAHAQAGGYIGIESMQVRYRAHGLDRETTIPLMEPIYFGP